MRCTAQRLIVKGGTYLGGVLPQELDEEWHDEVHQAVAPSQLHGDIGLDEIIARVQARREALGVVCVGKESKQVFHQIRLTTLGGNLHRVLH